MEEKVDVQLTWRRLFGVAWRRDGGGKIYNIFTSSLKQNQEEYLTAAPCLSEGRTC
jgi:hypothetical protein